MDAGKKWGLIRFSLTCMVLFLLWIILTGSLNGTSLLIGFAGSLGVAWLSYDVFIEKYEAGKRSVIPRLIPLIRYFFKLIIEIYKSSFQVLFSLFRKNVSPRVVHFKSRLHSDLARVALAHSITLTPGTITLELDEDHYIVHWLFASTRHSLKAGDEVKGALEEGIKKIWN